MTKGDHLVDDPGAALAQRIATQLTREMHPAVRAFGERLAAAADADQGADAVLFYGSNLRTGLLEGVLDFYILLPGAQKERIWPRVSYHEWDHDGVVLRAKVATMAMETFAEAAAGERPDTTIWARFVQPSGLVMVRDDAARARVVSAVGAAAQTAARLAVALGPERGSADAYWRALFRATYQAEFRVEKAGREDSILAVNADHFAGLLPVALHAAHVPFAQDGEIIHPAMPSDQRSALLKWWRRRRRLGKPLNILRLMKASTTFEGAARYAAWKVERHTGVAVDVTPWREKHPVLAAPGVLWKVWRAKRRG